MKKIDLLGQRFGKLVVIDNAESGKSGSAKWKCKCDCGNVLIIDGGHLRSGHTKSCGCHRLSVNDLSGRRFGRLTVLKEEERKDRQVYWLCECDCGKKIKVRTASLNNGHTQSCGCLQKSMVTTHGKKKTKLYGVWNSMKERCGNADHPAYKNYGGRGITVCKEWESDFVSFYNWAIDNGYEENLTIDRENNDGNYEPSNCRWVTSKVQRNNTRQNRYIELDGERRTIAEWAELKGINRHTLWDRIARRGWAVDRAINTPTGKYGRKNER